MSPASNDPVKRGRQLANLKRGGNAPPAAPGQGNRRAIRHGGYAAVAAETVDEKVRVVFDALTDDLPLRDSDGTAPAADAAMVRLAAEVLCRIDSVSTFLTLHGLFDEKGRPRTAVLELESRLRNEAADRLEALGLSPRSRARLGVDLARTHDVLAELMAEGTEAAQGEVVEHAPVTEEQR